MNNKNHRGFTLIEVLLSLALISLVIILSTNLVIFGTKAQKLTINEYDLQSSIRQATEKTNQIVRYSKAVFAVPQTFVSSIDKMDSDWDYFMVSPNGKSIVLMEYNNATNKHEEKVIVKERDNIIYETLFEKDNSGNTDSIMKYKIHAYTTDDEGSKSTEKIVFESTVESINAIQVADKGTESSPSIALAYRNDGQTSGKGKNQMAYITIIVDTSGSMNQTPADVGSTTSEHSDARIRYVREALAGDGVNTESGIIKQLSKEENVFVSFVPFSDTANYPSTTANTNQSAIHPIHEVNKSGDKDVLLTEIKVLTANGNTNTGDGLRRAYHLHNNFRTIKGIEPNTQVHHYTILLVDGQTNREVMNGIWEKKSFLFWTWWEFKKTNNSYYSDEGNIKLDQGSVNNNPNINYSITSSSGTGYVDHIGKLMKDIDNKNGVKSYIIGYAKNLGTHINSIGEKIGTEGTNIYSYDDPDFNLEEVLEDIANDIMADFWLVSGPQIQN